MYLLPTQQVVLRETLINSANEMKHETHGTQQLRHINMIDARERVPRNEVIRLCSQLISASLGKFFQSLLKPFVVMCDGGFMFAKFFIQLR